MTTIEDQAAAVVYDLFVAEGAPLKRDDIAKEKKRRVYETVLRALERAQ